MSLPSTINELLMGSAAGSIYNYTIGNSVRIRSSANAGLYRTPSSTTNSRTWTWSGWVKRGTLGTFQTIWDAFYGGNSRYTLLAFNPDDKLAFQSGVYGTGPSTTNSFVMNTTQVFRDPSAWYHIVVAFDTTQSTDTNRVKLFVNGSQVTAFTQYLSYNIYPSQNDTSFVNTNTQPFYIGYDAGQGGASDFYLAEMNFIDGQQLVASYFGETDTTAGIWKAKRYSGTYGTNGYYLKFDNAASTSTLGYDTSGNGNNFTVSNISLTSGYTYDWMTDSPTPVSSSVGNYCTLNPLDYVGSGTVSEGNLKYVGGGSGVFRGTFGMTASSGKWYWEVTQGSTVNSSNPIIYGVSSLQGAPSHSAPQRASLLYCDGATGHNVYIYNNGSLVTNVNVNITSIAVGDIIQFAYDSATGNFWVGKNNSWCDSSGGSTGNPTTGANPTYTMSSVDQPMTPTFDHAGVAYTAYLNCGQRPFSYTPPTGFKTLNTYNLPTPTIKQGNKYFDATLYTGNGSTQTITNSGSFQPDFAWIKRRSGTNASHVLMDAVRGASSILASNTTDPESNFDAAWKAGYGQLSSFNSNGITVVAGSSAGGNFNDNSVLQVAWQWKAGGTAVTNTNGTISSQVSANPTAGFSVVTYTGNGTAGATVGHGLGVKPALIIAKYRGGISSWPVYHQSLGATQWLLLNSTTASITSSQEWNNTEPTSSVFSIGSSSANDNQSGPNVAYCFAAIAGYSAFGSYTGNGSADGPFVFTNFQPRFVICKDSSNAGDWLMIDASRSPYNVSAAVLLAQSSGAEVTNTEMDLLSNGFKFRNTGAGSYANNSGQTYIYAAFASNPFQYSLAR